MRGDSERQKQKLREILRSLRESAGLRQVDLSMRLKRPQSFVSKYESGEKTLDFLEVREICRAMGVSMEQFVRKYEKETREG